MSQSARDDEFRDQYHIGTVPTNRRKLLRLYFDQGLPGVRDQLDDMCPGCITDLVVEYVKSDGERAIEAEFGSE